MIWPKDPHEQTPKLISRYFFEKLLSTCQELFRKEACEQAFRKKAEVMLEFELIRHKTSSIQSIHCSIQSIQSNNTIHCSKYWIQKSRILLHITRGKTGTDKISMLPLRGSNKDENRKSSFMKVKMPKLLFVLTSMNMFTFF